jgi:hypothetical protein
LHIRIGTELCLVVFIDDEERARPASTGTATHTAIAALAAVTRTPTGPEVTAAINAALPMYSPIEARAHKQKVAGLVAVYFWHLLPPPTWLFAGSEVELGDGRVDLLWRDSADRLLLDEIKTGAPRTLALSTTEQQVQRYLATARDIWGERFLGVRLLSLADWRRSVLVTPDGTRQPLRLTTDGS